MRWLGARPEIDGGAVGAIGNSEGGAIGPLAAVRVPVLALVGAKDLVLPAAPHLDRLRELFSAHPDFTGEILPGLNHLFQTAGTGSPLEYPLLDEAFSPAVAGRMADWIIERFGPLSG